MARGASGCASSQPPDLRHAGHVGTDGGNAARHAFEECLAKHLRNARLVAVGGAVHAGKDHAERATVGPYERRFVRIVTEPHRLARGEAPQLAEIALIAGPAHDLQSETLGQTL